MYQELRTSVSPDEREHLVLESWKEKNIFRRSVEERDAARVFILRRAADRKWHAGSHHVFFAYCEGIIAICRYKTMSGFRVERKAGWDTHGLPVEIAIEKELGFRHKGTRSPSMASGSLTRNARNSSIATSAATLVGARYDRAHGILGQYGRPIHHLHERLCRIRLVGNKEIPRCGTDL